MENIYIENLGGFNRLSFLRAQWKSCVSYYITITLVYLAWLKHSKLEEKKNAFSFSQLPSYSWCLFRVFLCPLYRRLSNNRKLTILIMF